MDRRKDADKFDLMKQKGEENDPRFSLPLIVPLLAHLVHAQIPNRANQGIKSCVRHRIRTVEVISGSPLGLSVTGATLAAL